MQEQLGAQSAEGRRLRRRVLRGTVLVCIVAGYQGKRFIYERAKELGIRYTPPPPPPAPDQKSAGASQESVLNLRGADSPKDIWLWTKCRLGGRRLAFSQDFPFENIVPNQFEQLIDDITIPKSISI